MNAPLWLFFNQFKRQSGTPLSIDQYFYFFEAMERLPANSITNVREFREFCKLFWLRDARKEELFDQLFQQILEWKALKEVFSPKEEVPTETHTGTGTGGEIHTEEENPEKTSGGSGRGTGLNPPEEGPAPGPGREDELVDFDLLIEESEEGQSVEAADSYTFQHTFLLNDQAIMPFNLRHLAQRLRRAVETQEYEPTPFLDLPQMIRQYCRHRYIEDIVYKMRDTGNSNIVLLADRFGSMLAYEFLEKQLALSIQAIPSCRFEHYYFYNLPEETDNQEHYKLLPADKREKPLYTDRHQWNKNTWFLIFSDAGGHSGLVNKMRLRKTLAFWRYLHGISPHVHWLNPIPFDCLNDSTAKRLQLSFSMTYPDQEGLNEITERRHHG